MSIYTHTLNVYFINYNDSTFYKYVIAQFMLQDHVNIKKKLFFGSDSTIFSSCTHADITYSLHFSLHGLYLFVRTSFSPTGPCRHKAGPCAENMTSSNFYIMSYDFPGADAWLSRGVMILSAAYCRRLPLLPFCRL